MKKMKYLFVSVLVFLMLTGCGESDNNQTGNPGASPNTNATDNNGDVNGTSNNDGITGNTNDNGTSTDSNSSGVAENAGDAVKNMGRGVADGVRDVGEGVADGIDNMTGDGNR